jgi:hypothetical protein
MYLNFSRAHLDGCIFLARLSQLADFHPSLDPYDIAWHSWPYSPSLSAHSGWESDILSWNEVAENTGTVIHVHVRTDHQTFWSLCLHWRWSERWIHCTYMYNVYMYNIHVHVCMYHDYHDYNKYTVQVVQFISSQLSGIPVEVPVTICRRIQVCQYQGYRSYPHHPLPHLTMVRSVLSGGSRMNVFIQWMHGQWCTLWQTCSVAS